MELVCVEMVTGVVLLTHKIFNFSNGSISVCVNVLNERTVDIKVSFSGLHTCSNINGSTLLSHLVKESIHLKHAVHSSMIRLSYGNNDIVSVIELNGSTINKYTQPGHFLYPANLQLEAIKVPLVSSAKDVPISLHRQLYLYHIINPHLSFTLRISLSEMVLQYSFERGGSCLSIPSSPFRLLSSIKHYIDTRVVSTTQIKLKILRGITCTLPGYSSDDLEHSVDLKLYSAIAIAPELKLIPGRKIPANRVCNKLHIYVFSSGNVPLISSGTHANFNLQDIAVWSDYGISIGSPINNTSCYSEDLTDVLCVPSFSFHLKSSSRTIDNSERAIHLFLFIEPVQETSGCTTPFQCWINILTLTNTLRNDFASLVTLHAKKFQRTCNSALNKIFCNYTSFTKTKTSVDKSLPLLSEAVTDIISNSKKRTFKVEACHLLHTEEEGENSYEVLLGRLKDLSDRKISRPEEPTTPELMIATRQPLNASSTTEYHTVPYMPNETHQNTTNDYDNLVPELTDTPFNALSTIEHTLPYDSTQSDTTIENPIPNTPFNALSTIADINYDDDLTQSDTTFNDANQLTESNYEDLSNFDCLTQLDEDILSLTQNSIELHDSVTYNEPQNYLTQLSENHDNKQIHYSTEERIVPDIANSDNEWDHVTDLIISPLPETITSPHVSESDFKWD